MSKEIRQNRSNWRKIRGWKNIRIRMRKGYKFVPKKCRTPEWEKVG